MITVTSWVGTPQHYLNEASQH